MNLMKVYNCSLSHILIPKFFFVMVFGLTYQHFGESSVQLICGGHGLLAPAPQARLPDMLVLGTAADVVAQILFLQRAAGDGTVVLVAIAHRVMVRMRMGMLQLLIGVHISAGDGSRFDGAHYGGKATRARNRAGDGAASSSSSAASSPWIL